MRPTLVRLLAPWAATIAAPFVSARQSGASEHDVTPSASRGAPVLAGEAAGDAWQLTLEDAVGLALRDNLGLSRAQSEADAARFDALSAWGEFDWVFAASAQYADAEQEGSTALAGGSVVETESSEFALDLTRPFTTGASFAAHFDTAQRETTNSFFNAPELVEDSLRLSYVHPLLRGAGYEATTSQQQIADLTAQRGVEASRGTRQQLIADVAAAYWDLVAALEQREVRRSALDLGREQLVREEQRLAAGDGTEVDVLQARTEIATRSEQLLQSENDVASAADALRALLLADQDADGWRRTIEPMTPLPEVSEAPIHASWEAAWQVALERRSELRQTRLDVDAARLRLRRANSDRLADLDLTFNLSSGANDEQLRDAARDTFQFDFPTWSVLLRYELPLGNRTAVNAEHAARERVRTAIVRHQEQELAVLADVRRAVREVQYRATAVAASAESLDLAQRQLDAERARFDAELSTTFRVLEFQQAWIEASSNARRARADYAKSLVDLRRAQGLVGETP